MAVLRIPSVQHLARNWRDDPKVIANQLVRLAQDPPRFNYNPLYSAIRDLLLLRVPYEQVVEGIRRSVKRVSVRDNLFGVMPLIRDYFEGISPDFFQTVERRYYPVGRGLMVPFDPPMIYGVEGQLYFPWFSFWRQNPLAKRRMSLFVTLVDEILMQDPDLEAARFEILDFSCPSSRKPRDLTIVDASLIERVSDEQKKAMLETFADGFMLARAMLSELSPTAERGDAPPTDPNQPGLFD